MRTKISALFSRACHWVYMLLIGVAILSVSCEQSEVNGSAEPSVKVEIRETTDSSISFMITSTNASEVTYLVTEASDGMHDAEYVLQNGRPSVVNQEYIVKVNDLDSDTTYLVSVAAKSDKGFAVTHEIVTTKSSYYNEVDLDFPFVRRLEGENYAETDFALFFTDVDPEYELTLVLQAEDSEILPEGAYSTEGGVNANIDAKRSFLRFTNGDEPIFFDKIEAWVACEQTDDYFYFDIRLYAGNTMYTVVVHDYVGNMPMYDISNMVFDRPIIRKSEDGKRATLIFNSEDEKATFVAETYIPSRMYLEPGVYNVATDEDWYEPFEIDAHNSWFIANGYYSELKSGAITISIDVSADDDYDYIYDVDIVDELGREIKFECRGPVPSDDLYISFTVDSAEFNEVESGLYRISFDGNYSLSFDICADEFVEGIYPIADIGEAYRPYIDKSSLRFSSATLGDIAIRDGKVRIIEIEDDFWEFRFKLQAQNSYNIWTGTYYGALNNFIPES